MKLKSIILSIVALIAASAINAQPLTEPRKVNKPQLTDLKKNPVNIPNWG